MDVRDFIRTGLESSPDRLAKDLGLPRTTVWSWVQKNRVPAWRLPKLAELALARGKSFPAKLGD